MAQTIEWHILRTTRDAAACEWLGRLKIESYRPVRNVAVQRKHKPRVCSLFGGYVFVRFLPHQEDWPTVCALPGVIGYLRRDDVPATISNEAVEVIREYEMELRTTRHAKWAFAIGSKVRISSNVPPTNSAFNFVGYEGLLHRLDKKDRAVVELLLPGRCMPLTLSAQWLEPVEELAQKRRISANA